MRWIPKRTSDGTSRSWPRVAVGLAVAWAVEAYAADAYEPFDAYGATLRSIAAAHPAICRLTSIGRSRQGRELWCLQLAAPGPREPDNRTALLIVAGLDGNSPADTAVAVGLTRRLLAPESPNPEIDKLLREHTVYVLPRMNPDAVETYFATPKYEETRVMRPRDDDRDGAVDEDGPEDVNGDGLITQMRVQDPEKADSLPDRAEPRLMKKADPVKGETPVYKVYIEGVDNDGDEEINEDAPGGVALQQNFPHGFREHSESGGPYALSESESRGLVDFVLAHPRIAIAVSYGRHDNLIETPKGDKKDETGQAPVDLHADDVAWYKEMGEKFRKLTEFKNAPPSDPAGTLHAWAYAQFGIPAFAVATWTRPESGKLPPTSAPSSQPGDATSQPTAEPSAETQTATQPASDRPVTSGPPLFPPASVEGPPAAPPETGTGQSSRPAESGGSVIDRIADIVRPAGRRRGGSATADLRPRGAAGEEDKPDDKRESADKDTLAWLAYNDRQREGAGFIAWTPFEHPTLGAVELGGFVPFFRTTPPEGEFDRLIGRHAAFLLDLVGRFPSVTFSDAKVTLLGPGVYEIEVFLVNSGYFPLATAMGQQNRRVRPAVVTLDLPQERILGGRRVEKVWSLAGSGGRQKFRWLIRGSTDEKVRVKVTSEKLGDFELNVRLPVP